MEGSQSFLTISIEKSIGSCTRNFSLQAFHILKPTLPSPCKAMKPIQPSIGWVASLLGELGPAFWGLY